MKAQLEKLLRLIQEERATVHVIPYEVGACAAVDSNFDYLGPGGSSLPELAFAECLASYLYQQRPAEIERYTEALDDLRGTALSPRNSARGKRGNLRRISQSQLGRRIRLFLA